MFQKNYNKRIMIIIIIINNNHNLYVNFIRPEIINMLLVKMFGQSEKTESTLLGGISILQTLLMSTKSK